MGNLGLLVFTVRPMVVSIRLYAVEGNKKDTDAPHGEAENMLFLTATILTSLEYSLHCATLEEIK